MYISSCDEKKIKCTLKLASQLSSRTISLKNHHWLNDMLLSKECMLSKFLKDLNTRKQLVVFKPQATN